MHVLLKINTQPGRMKISLIFIISLFTLQACGLGGGVNIPQEIPSSTQQALIPNTGGACENPVYPVRQGAAWTYASSGGPNGTFAYTDTITEVRADGFTLTSQFTEFTRAQEWACNPEGLKALQLGGGTTAGISIQGMTAEFTTLDITGISLPKEITAGMQWQYALKMQGSVAMPGEQQAQSTGIYTTVMQEIGRETVRVAAGTFEAVKIQVNSSVDITASFEGVEVPIKFNGISIIWYAPGVGYVKSVENGDFGGTAFSAVTELQTYTIP